MSDLQDLIDTADKLCASLDRAAANEKKFCGSICDQLEKMSWETMCMANDLKTLREYHQGAF